MNCLLEDSLKLNDEAIVLMRDGKPVQSSLALRKALENLETCFKCKRSQSPSQHQQSEGISVRRSQRLMPSIDQPTDSYDREPQKCLEEEFAFRSVSIENHWTDQMQAISSQNVFSLYPRMFHIASACTTEVHLKKALLILMFNEAITRHIMAALFVHEHKIYPDHHLTRVLALYEAVIQAARTSVCFEDAKQMLAVVVAATNNFGHVASQLMLFTETRDSIDYMIRLLEISDDKSFALEDVHLFFQSICIFLEDRNLKTAPAA